MAILRVKEHLGSQLMINTDKVYWISESNGHAEFWFSPADVDTIRTEESLEDVEKMIAVSEGVVTLRHAEAIRMLPAEHC